MEILYATERVEKFLEELDLKSASRARTVLVALSERGSRLGMPFSKALSKGLFELRIFGETPVRLFYGFKFGRVVILHGFIKKTQQIPQKEIEYARRILAQI